MEARERLLRACEEAGIGVQALQGGSRKRECTELRKRLELGMTYAGSALQLGISAAAINRIVKRCES
jgi:putative transposase